MRQLLASKAPAGCRMVEILDMAFSRVSIFAVDLGQLGCWRSIAFIQRTATLGPSNESNSSFGAAFPVILRVQSPRRTLALNIAKQ